MENRVLNTVIFLFSLAFLITSCTKQSASSTENVGVTTFSIGDTANFQGTAIWVYGAHNGVPFTANIVPGVIANQSYVFPEGLTVSEFGSLEVSVLRYNSNTSLSFALGASYSLQGQNVFPLRYMNIQFQTDGAGYINGSYNPSDTVNIKENAIYSLP
jgi:hypothetical protein